MDGLTLLLQAQAAGLRVEAAGGLLKISGPKRAEPVVRLLAAHKADVLAALAPEAIEARRWQERYTARTFEWLIGDRNWAEAKRLAWGDLENEWHEQHGQRWPAWQCAGCGQPMSGAATLDLPDGNRVHLELIECLITFGRHWRGDADAALTGFGLKSPCQGRGEQSCLAGVAPSPATPPNIHPGGSKNEK